DKLSGSPQRSACNGSRALATQLDGQTDKPPDEHEPGQPAEAAKDRVVPHAQDARGKRQCEYHETQGSYSSLTSAPLTKHAPGQRHKQHDEVIGLVISPQHGDEAEKVKDAFASRVAAAPAPAEDQQKESSRQSHSGRGVIQVKTIQHFL